MRSKHSRRIVVDTSVVRAASTRERPDPRGRICREILEAVRDNKHKIVLTPAISEEWKRHRSTYTSTWLRSMFGRKLVEDIRPDENSVLRQKISGFAASKREEEAMLKDVHLLEAALSTDRTIIALDQTVRDLFVALSKNVAEIGMIVWVNPEGDETVVMWIEQGALPDRNKMLGA